MNILLVDNMPERRGAQIFLRLLAGGLEKAGHHVSLIYLFRCRNKGAVFTDNLQHILFDYNWSGPLEKFLKLNPLIIWNLFRHIKNERPDLILINGSKALKYGGLVRLLTGKKLLIAGRIIDSVSYWNPTAAGRWFYRRLIIPLFNGWVAVSRDSAEAFRLLYPSGSPIRVIPRGIEIGEFPSGQIRNEIRQKLGIQSGEFVLLFAGAFTSQKDPAEFIEVVKLLLSRGIKVKAIMTGSGPLEVSAANLIRSAGLSHAIHLAGQVDCMPAYYEASDLLVLVSRSEGIPGVVLEAAAAGVPAIAYATGGISECIEHNRTGWLVNSGDRQSMTELIANILKEPKIILSVGSKARKKIMQEFGLPAVVSDYFRFFEDLSQLHGSELNPNSAR